MSTFDHPWGCREQGSFSLTLTSSFLKEDKADSAAAAALNLSPNGIGSINMSVEINGTTYAGEKEPGQSQAGGTGRGWHDPGAGLCQNKAGTTCPAWIVQQEVVSLAFGPRDECPFLLVVVVLNI